jgi:signal transduction histidine kinase
MAMSPRRPFLLPLTLLLVGLLSMLLMVLTRRFQEASVVGDLAALQAVGEIEAQAAIVHLWLEEFVSGDEEIALEEIARRLNRAGSLADLLTGRKVPSQVADPASLEVNLLPMAESLHKSLAAFTEISNDRVLGVARGLDVGIGSDFDVETDRIFRRLLADVDLLQTTLRAERSAHAARDTRTFRALLLGWTLLISATTWLLFERERRQLRAEVALRASESQLQRAQKLDAVGRLAGGLAHDIKNYLAAIRSQAELVLRKSADEKVVGKMELVTGTVDRAAHLIDRLLAFSRRQPAARVELALNALVLNLVPVFEPTLSREVRLVLDLEPELWPIFADPAQLEQVIMNLLVNAQEAVGTAAVGTAAVGTAAVGTAGTLRLRTRNRGSALDQPGHVLLSVEDDGVGIAAEDLERIFEPFFTTKKREDGEHEHSGLGLATAYGIVKEHGGSLEVSSELGRGTIFEVALPRHLPSRHLPSRHLPFMKDTLESPHVGATSP